MSKQVIIWTIVVVIVVVAAVGVMMYKGQRGYDLDADYYEIQPEAEPGELEQPAAILPPAAQGEVADLATDLDALDADFDAELNNLDKELQGI